MSKTIKSSARNVLFRLISSYPHELNEVQKNRREINASLATIENIAGEIQDIEKKNDLKNALLSLRIKLLPREEYTEKKHLENVSSVLPNEKIKGLKMLVRCIHHGHASRWRHRNVVVPMSRARALHATRWLAATEDVKAPNFPDSISTGDVKFVKKEGDSVNMDEVVMEIETDKTAIPVMSPGNGKLTKFYVKEGEAVKSQQVLFQVDVTSTTPAATPAASAPSAQAPAAAPAATPAPSAAPGPAPAAKAVSASAQKAPVAVKMASGGISKQASTNGVRPEQISGTRNETAVRMNKMRLRIAQRLKEAQNTAAMLTTYNEIDMSKIIAFRKSVMDSFQQKHGVRMSFMSPFIKACVNALLDQPVVNAVIEGDSIIYRDFVDISFAAATPRGLVVPVIRNAESMNFANIELAMSALATKARDGKLSPSDMAGGTFTISNGGVFGSLLSSPIINPPQSAILGMHATFMRPVAIEGKVEIRPMMYVALTYDHRIIDGREAVFFLRKVKSGVEEPTTILAGV